MYNEKDKLWIIYIMSHDHVDYVGARENCLIPIILKINFMLTNAIKVQVALIYNFRNDCPFP